MPRQQALSSIVPNRFYEINATLKYQHIGQNSITGIIEQNDVQSKICIPKTGIQLQEGKQYTFGKCFNSRNGWLYAKNPSETVVEKPLNIRNMTHPINLEKIAEHKDSLANYYITTLLKVIEIEPKHTIMKNDNPLVLYKLKGFADQLVVQLDIWNQQIKAASIIGKVISFEGFKVKMLPNGTFSLVSTVYSKLHQASLLSADELVRFDYKLNVLYNDLSKIFQLRSIQQIMKECETNQKTFSTFSGSISSIEEMTYQGCSKCRKKTNNQICYQCNSKVQTAEYKYLKVIVEDQSGLLETAVFNEQLMELVLRIYNRSKAIFNVKSSSKRHQQTNQLLTSHIITQVKQFLNN